MYFSGINQRKDFKWVDLLMKSKKFKVFPLSFDQYAVGTL